MKQTGRVLVVALVAVCAYYVAFGLSLALLPFGAGAWLAPVVGIVGAVVAARHAWDYLGRGIAGEVVPTMVLWAVVAGGLGFVGGFFGPMIFAPEANQGPLLGIFITGPLGFVLGGAAGFVYGVGKRARNRPRYSAGGGRKTL